MKPKSIYGGKRLPPWLPAQNLDDTGDQTSYTINDQLSHFKSRITKLLGTNIHIQGYCHGWVILSNKNMWSLWNPVSSEIINLPPLILNKKEHIGQFCLSSPPNEPTSVLLLNITHETTFVVCQLGFKIDRLRWTRMPYTWSLKQTIGHYGDFLHSLTSCNGQVYGLLKNSYSYIDSYIDKVIQLDTEVSRDNGEEFIRLSPLLEQPKPPIHTSYPISILKGSGTELFFIKVDFNDDTIRKNSLGNVYLFKWDMDSDSWEEMVDIKDSVFFIDLACDYSVYYKHAIAAKLGGYIHIRDKTGKMMYTYDFEDKTVSQSSLDYPLSNVSSWECWSEGYYEDSNNKLKVRSATNDEVELNESKLLNLPCHLLELIMDHCIGVEYMSFRATCKSFHLAAPFIQWSNNTSSRKLYGYSLVSAWLMVVNKTHGIINFLDPVSGDKYFMKRPPVSIKDDRIHCSRFGWLLLHRHHYNYVFFNPFTNFIRKLPLTYKHYTSMCFTAPPTSPDCMVVGFVRQKSLVFIHFVAGEQTWRMIRHNYGGCTFYYPTFIGDDLYFLCENGKVFVIKNLYQLQGYYIQQVARKRSCKEKYFLVKRDQQLLLVIVGNSGKKVEVFELNDCAKEVTKIESLGKFTIYIDSTTCLCIEAKSPEMENKIFFPRLNFRNGKVLFYSLETHKYHIFNGKKVEDVAGVGWEHAYPHAWIEPTWC